MPSLYQLLVLYQIREKEKRLWRILTLLTRSQKFQLEGTGDVQSVGGVKNIPAPALLFPPSTGTRKGRMVEVRKVRGIAPSY